MIQAHLKDISEQTLLQEHVLVEIKQQKHQKEVFIVQLLLARFIQQSLLRLFNSHWHDSETVTGTGLQKSLARFFNSYSHSRKPAGHFFLIFEKGHATPPKPGLHYR